MCTLRYFIVIEGERTKCHCFITGQPNPTIRWLYNCVSLDIVFNKRKYSLQLLSNDKVTLTIEDWSQEAAGEIIIIVENRADLTQCSAVLTVEYDSFDQNKMSSQLPPVLPRPDFVKG
ncbi:unnamed protein product [Rotaria sp. Silwood1]|nr:unnamed protein product [Rotaria sp. Silwood1]